MNNGFGGMNQNMPMNNNMNNMGMGMNNMGMNNDMNMNNNMGNMGMNNNGFGMNNNNGMNNMGMNNNGFGMNMNNGNNQNFNNMMMNNMNNMNNMNMNMNDMSQAMMQNMQANQMQNIPQMNNQSSFNSKNINVYFRAGEQQNQQPQPEDQAGRIQIQATLDEKVSSIIDKYRNKTGDKEEKRFVFNAKSLNQTLTAAEAGLMDNSTIFVLRKKDVKGA
jgi:hypothetical protein